MFFRKLTYCYLKQTIVKFNWKILAGKQSNISDAPKIIRKQENKLSKKFRDLYQKEDILYEILPECNRSKRPSRETPSFSSNFKYKLQSSNGLPTYSTTEWYRSNISTKLISGFLIICVLTVIVGYQGLVATQQVEYLYQVGIRLAEVESFTEKYLIIAKEASTYIQNGILIGVALTIISSIGIAIWMLSSIRKTIELEKKSFATEFRIKNERLLAMGELASRLSHDLRNPLMVIKETLKIMQMQYKGADEKTIKRFSRINIAASSMTRLIEHMLNFVRASKLDIGSNSIREIIRSAINQVDKPENVRINYPSSDLKINCDFRMLEIVFMNLILNAIQAMKENGEITILVNNEEKDVLIQVEDSGPGIPYDVLPKIFDPLFTTKVYGTGLGLASCKSIVEQHKGKISVKNNPTVFIIALPGETSELVQKKQMGGVPD